MSEKITPEAILDLYRKGTFYYTVSTGINDGDMMREPKPMQPIDDRVIIPSSAGKNITVKNNAIYHSIIVTTNTVDVMSKKYNVAIYTEEERTTSSFTFNVLLLKSDFLILNLRENGAKALQPVGEKSELITDIPNHKMVIYEPHPADKTGSLFIRKTIKLELEQGKLNIAADEEGRLYVSGASI